MQPNKNGYLYVLDRTTGEPVWPIEERPVDATMEFAGGGRGGRGGQLPTPAGVVAGLDLRLKDCRL
jgi:hypothetical protein